jgi:hypothetical protein
LEFEEPCVHERRGARRHAASLGAERTCSASRAAITGHVPALEVSHWPVRTAVGWAVVDGDRIAIDGELDANDEASSKRVVFESVYWSSNHRPDGRLSGAALTRREAAPRRSHRRTHRVPRRPRGNRSCAARDLRRRTPTPHVQQRCEAGIGLAAALLIGTTIAVTDALDTVAARHLDENATPGAVPSPSHRSPAGAGCASATTPCSLWYAARPWVTGATRR